MTADNPCCLSFCFYAINATLFVIVSQFIGEAIQTFPYAILAVIASQFIDEAIQMFYYATLSATISHLLTKQSTALQLDLIRHCESIY